MNDFVLFSQLFSFFTCLDTLKKIYVFPKSEFFFLSRPDRWKKKFTLNQAWKRRKWSSRKWTSRLPFRADKKKMVKTHFDHKLHHYSWTRWDKIACVYTSEKMFFHKWLKSLLLISMHDKHFFTMKHMKKKLFTGLDKSSTGLSSKNSIFTGLDTWKNFSFFFLNIVFTGPH